LANRQRGEGVELSAEEYIRVNEQGLRTCTEIGEGGVDLAFVAGEYDLGLPSIVRAPSCTPVIIDLAASAFAILTRTARRLAAGSSSCIKPTHFAPISRFIVLMPVRLPPGLLRLVTRPACTGSAPIVKTIGISVVAALVARAAATVSSTTMSA